MVPLSEFQGKKVPTRAYVPNLTLSVRFGHTYYDLCFSNSFCAKYQNIIKHKENYKYRYLLPFVYF